MCTCALKAESDAGDAIKLTCFVSANLAPYGVLVTVVCYGQDGAALLTELTQCDTGHDQLAAPPCAILLFNDVTSRGAGVALYLQSGLGHFMQWSMTQED